jgi:UDP-N-acetylmuramyl pentapeptide phosphotransferase/UDP-N-acetylglucosamine-1-phosphate transferase
MTPGEFVIYLVALTFGAAGAAWLTTRFDLRKPNFRGARIPSMAGLFVVLAGVFFYAVEWLSEGVHEAIPAVYLLVTLCFGVLGALDDVCGDRSVGGFRGHLGALRRGRFTTGLGKMVGGGVASLVAGWLIHRTHPWEALLAALLIALTANTVNLLDVRPGRSLFGFFLGAVAVVAVLHAWRAVDIGFFFYFAVVIAVLLYPLDASARVMLGDTGSNAFGAILGVAFAVFLSLPSQIGVAVGLVLFQIWCEKYSLSKTIESTPWLRSLDAKIGVRK